MKIAKNISRYVSFITLKLLVLVLVTMALYFYTIFFVANYILPLHDLAFLIPFLFNLLPIIAFGYFYCRYRHKDNFIALLAHYKYSLIFPFYYEHDPNPKSSERIDIMEIKNKIEPGDIILRKYDRYLDGLVFSENSFFSHVGIYCSGYKGIHEQVFHATSEFGVHRQSLAEFCRCDDLAILRFSFDKIKEEEDIEKIINDDARSYTSHENIKKDEKEIFDRLMQETKPSKEKTTEAEKNSYAEGYSNIIFDRAISLEGTDYDLNFNFKDFTHFSCIEYVWFCFKCLFPLHRIRVKDFEFFRWIRMPAIIPDVFIRNDFFGFVYTTLPITQNKSSLISYVKPLRRPAGRYLLSIFIWNAIILVVCYLVQEFWKYTPVSFPGY